VSDPSRAERAIVRGDEFSEDERKRLREMLTAHERAVWFWSSLGIWLKWLAAASAAVIAVKVLLGDARDVIRAWLLK
jgi:hypothetical protein